MVRHIKTGLGSAAMAVMLALLLFTYSVTLAQDEDDEPLYRPGLVATYSQGESAKATRVDRTFAFNWRDAAPDRRLAEGKFAARWQGLLQTEGEGTYQLYAYAAGRVSILLDGKVVLEGNSEQPVWMVGKGVELPYGYYPLEVRFEKTAAEARIALYWTGPKFQLEPLGERQIVHRREQTPDVRFERGEQLVRALRCAACHEIDGESSPVAAPDLTHLAGNISRAWLVDWLAEEHGKRDAGKVETANVIRRMPDFGLSRDEATAVAAWLLKSSRAADVGKDKPGKRDDGETLFLTTGCLACHKVGDFGESGLFGGGDLTHVGDKRPPEFFARWLAEPAKLNSQHRMPVFELSAKERSDLAAYLSGLKSESKSKENASKEDEAKLAERGKTLVERHKCQACHAPESDAAKTTVRRLLNSKSPWDAACSGEPNVAKNRPGYRLSAADGAAVQTFVSAMSHVKKSVAAEPDGAYLLAERNCVACHARDASPGLAARLTTVAEAKRELAPLLPAMTPPPLASVGDKLHDLVLADAISRKGPVHRPWLKVRMPRFDLSPAEQQSLVRHFVDADRIPDRTPVPKTLPNADALHVAGARLVTTDGFGCTSCHQVGKVLPPKAPLNAMGPDLSLTGRRVREPWFDRWVRNPARIVPRMEMPSVQIPVRGVLAEKLDHQLAAVWHMLNESGFEPPLPNPVRSARRIGLEKQNERSLVLTDVLKQDKQVWTKPLLVGLPNRHNALFDLETNRLAGWWLGDTARQRTQGKTWFWEPGSGDLLRSGLEGSEVLLVRDGRPLEPLVVGQFPTEIDSWEHEEGGILFQRRLRFANGKGEPTIVTVKESWSAFWFLEELGASGWHRDLVFEGVPAGASIQFRLVAKDRIEADVRDDGGWSLDLKGAGGVRIEIDMDHEGQADRSGAVLLQGEDDGAALDLRLDYISTLPIDLFPLVPVPPVPVDPVKLDVVPGFEAVRLPLSDEIMPTALAWRPDGRLVVASLKGQVFLAKPPNRDGLEDKLELFSDELAAPYGLLAAEKHVDVITKSALLRLHDNDNDGRAERTETLASGWGHTADYHDWVVGIETDEKGNRYIAIPCEQDKRPLAAAHLRGTVVKLEPRKPTKADPRLYSLDVVSGGHRFPMGLARSRAGEMFVTDNQGNYNPFNELNHVVHGARYGFINSHEKGKEFKTPPLPAAIELPHPWTRSVNGICFLYTPAAVGNSPVGNALRGVPNLRKEDSAPRNAKEGVPYEGFGPFEGHLIGCEYDTRRLIRMTLDRVEGVIQGACYPFTYDVPRKDESLLGPLVCAVSPQGDLYVGCIRDSGWGGSNNIGAITRLRPQFDKLPAGIAEAKATKCGFTLDFTQPVNAELGGDATNYSVASYRRISTPAYGGPDVDRRVEKIVSVSLSSDARRATLELPELREGFVYVIRLKNLAGDKREFHPAEAYYTLRKTPR